MHGMENKPKASLNFVVDLFEDQTVHLCGYINLSLGTLYVCS